MQEIKLGKFQNPTNGFQTSRRLLLSDIIPKTLINITESYKYDYNLKKN